MGGLIRGVVGFLFAVCLGMSVLGNIFSTPEGRAHVDARVQEILAEDARDVR